MDGPTFQVGDAVRVEINTERLLWPLEGYMPNTGKILEVADETVFVTFDCVDDRGDVWPNYEWVHVTDLVELPK